MFVHHYNTDSYIRYDIFVFSWEGCVDIVGILIHIMCYHISIIYSLLYIGNGLEMQHLFVIITTIYPFDMEHLYSLVKIIWIMSKYLSTPDITIICRICVTTQKCNILCHCHIDTSRYCRSIHLHQALRHFSNS